MSNYTGYRCPVCGKAFAQGDDVVVCPDCGAPHHRECYRSLGRCAYEEKHAAGEAWSPATAAGEEEGAWKNVLTAAGYQVDCVLEGLGEIPVIRQMYLERLASPGC